MSGGIVSIDQKDVQKFNGGMAGTSPVQRNALDLVFDSSGWAVATGGSKSSATSEKQESEGLSLPPWLLVAVAGLVVVGWIRTNQ